MRHGGPEEVWIVGTVALDGFEPHYTLEVTNHYIVAEEERSALGKPATIRTCMLRIGLSIGRDCGGSSPPLLSSDDF
jgi:hypothetical protein